MPLEQPVQHAVFIPTLPRRLYPWLIFAVLAVLVAVEAYGFRNGHLFSQTIWLPEGYARLLQFGALYVATAAALLILAPWIFAGLAAALLLLLTAIAVGPVALLSVCFFLISAWSLGALLMGRKRLPRNPLWPHLLSLLLGIAIYIFLIVFAVRLPVNYASVYALALALPILANLPTVRRDLPGILRKAASFPLRSWGERLGCAAFLFVLIVHWFAVLEPETSADGLSIHLAIPANIAAHHVMTFDPSRLTWAVMPMGADFIWSIVFLLGGEMAARLLNLAILLVLLGLLYAAVRRWVSPAVAWLLVTLFATTPMVQLVTGSLFVENLLAALVLGMMIALWRFGEAGERRLLYVAATLGGTAMATKFGAIAILLPALACAAVEVWRRKQSGVRWAIAFGLMLLAAAPPYAIAWVKTGNPIFPFRNEKFHSRQLDPKADIRDIRFHESLTWSTPYDLTFRTNRYYEGQHGSFGFQYLVITPLALLALLVWPRRQAVGAAAVAVTAILLVLGTEPNARYLYPALPLLFVPLAALLGWAAGRQRALALALTAFSIACAAINVYFLPASSWYHKDFYGPFTPVQREAYAGEAAPIRNVIAWFNRAHPRSAVLLTQDSYIAGLDGDVYENHWHQYATLDQIRRAPAMQDVRALLDRWKVRYLIARKATAINYARPVALRELLDRCTIAEYVFHEYYVARLEPVCSPAAARLLEPVLTAKPGTYDDFDPSILLLDSWERDNHFDRAFEHTVSYTGTPGAEVRFAFEGHELTYVFTRAANRGTAAVTIDGADRGTIDLYSVEPEWQSSARFTGLGEGRHLLVIRATGERRAASTGNFIDLDALLVK